MFQSKHLLAAVAVAVTLSAAPMLSFAADKPAVQNGQETEIPFASFGGIEDWRSDGSHALYIRGRGMDQWYHATLMGPCTDLPFANTIGVEEDARNVVDRFSSIVVGGQKCALSSFVKSDPPPSDKKKPSDKKN